MEGPVEGPVGESVGYKQNQQSASFTKEDTTIRSDIVPWDDFVGLFSFH